jgi:predicted NBD/HSP70 family sugar kinase
VGRSASDRPSDPGHPNSRSTKEYRTVSLFVGVDIGGTTTTIAIGDADRRVVCVSDQFPTRSDEGPDVTIGDIVAQITSHLSELDLAVDDVKSISLATPGPASEDGVLVQSPNLRNKDWDRCPVRLKLEQSFARHAAKVPVCYVGDGQAAALGEYVIRTGQFHWDGLSPEGKQMIAAGNSEITSLFLLAVGTGLGGGEVRDGAPIRGCKGRAGHAGHLMLPAEAFRYEHDQQLKVGNAYCTTESAISLTALTHQLGYRLTLDQWRNHPLNQQDGTVRDKAKKLRELAATGDPLALQLFDDQAKAMGIAMLMLNYIGDYDLLVIGGGVCEITSELRRRYIEVAQQAYYDRALDGFRDFSGISFSLCGDSASVIGSLANAYRGHA